MLARGFDPVSVPDPVSVSVYCFHGSILG